MTRINKKNKHATYPLDHHSSASPPAGSCSCLHDANTRPCSHALHAGTKRQQPCAAVQLATVACCLSHAICSQTRATVRQAKSLNMPLFEDGGDSTVVNHFLNSVMNELVVRLVLWH